MADDWPPASGGGHATRLRFRRAALAALTAGPPLAAATSDPVVYTLRFPAPDTHTADVEVRIPRGGNEIGSDFA
jgi:hypothetical protein